VFPYLVWRVCCLHEWLCGTGDIGVLPACTLCCDVYSSAVCWPGVELCVLIFCMVVICGVEYRILYIRQCFVHLFILLVRTINMRFSKSVRMTASLGYLYYIYCALYVSIRVPCLSYCCA
jgi:hypothetical protein